MNQSLGENVNDAAADGELITNVSLNFFENNLSKDGKPSKDKNEWTVYSAILQKEEGENYKVVSCGTGTKCLGQSHYSSQGNKVHDSHGEVIAKRAFIRYISKQLELFIEKDDVDDDDNCIFTTHDENARICRLKKSITFHFFTTHPPCGDASLIDTCKKIKLDTGAKSAHDTQQDQIVGVVRTKPGKGDPTQSLSCSDKLLKWRLDGLQGRILRHFVGVISYDSITIACPSQFFNRNSVMRALVTRYPYNSPNLIINYSDKKFEFCQSEVKNPCPTSVVWSANDSLQQVIIDGRKSGVIKKHLETPKSVVKICRLEIAKEIFEVIKKHPNFYKIYGDILDKPIKYSDLKTFESNLRTEMQDLFPSSKSRSLNEFYVSSPRIWIFKAQVENDKYLTKLQELGYAVNLIPVIDFKFINIEELRKKLIVSSNYDGLILTSPRTVEAVKLAIESSTYLLENKKIFTVGPTTFNTIKEVLGIEALGSESGDGNNLAKFINSNESYKDLRFIFPCSNLSKESDLYSLNIDKISVYETIEHPSLEKNIKRLSANKDFPTFILYFSPSGVNSSYPYIKNIISNCKVIALGSTTKGALESNQIKIFRVAKKPTLEDMEEEEEEVNLMKIMLKLSSQQSKTNNLYDVFINMIKCLDLFISQVGKILDECLISHQNSSSTFDPNAEIRIKPHIAAALQLTSQGPWNLISPLPSSYINLFSEFIKTESINGFYDNVAIKEENGSKSIPDDLDFYSILKINSNEDHDGEFLISDSNPIYSCECGKQFQSKARYHSHLNTKCFSSQVIINNEEQDKIDYYCMNCCQPFQQRKLMEDHVNNCNLPKIEITYKENGEGRSLCLLCPNSDRTWKIKRSFHLHFTKEHVPDELKTILCTYCPNKYYNQSLLRDHIRMTHELLHHCSICKKSFNQKQLLQWHINIEHSDPNENKYVCTYDGCKYKSGHKKNFRTHVKRMHMEQKPTQKNFKCDECDTFFYTSKSLYGHKYKKHMNVEPVLCTVCAKEFSNKYYLANHMMRIHDDNCKRCEKCGWKYTSKKGHETECGRRFYCEECGNGYSGMSLLKRHIDQVHRGIKNSCPHCKMHIVKAAMSVHLKYHCKEFDNGDRNVKCPHCDSVVNKSALKRHIQHYCKNLNLNKHHPCPNNCGKVFSAHPDMKTHFRKCRYQ